MKPEEERREKVDETLREFSFPIFPRSFSFFRCGGIFFFVKLIFPSNSKNIFSFSLHQRELKEKITLKKVTIQV